MVFSNLRFYPCGKGVGQQGSRRQLSSQHAGVWWLLAVGEREAAGRLLQTPLETEPLRGGQEGSGQRSCPRMGAVAPIWPSFENWWPEAWESGEGTLVSQAVTLCWNPALPWQPPVTRAVLRTSSKLSSSSKMRVRETWSSPHRAVERNKERT